MPPTHHLRLLLRSSCNRPATPSLTNVLSIEKGHYCDTKNGRCPPWMAPAVPRHRGAACGHVSPWYRIWAAGKPAAPGELAVPATRSAALVAAGDHHGHRVGRDRPGTKGEGICDTQRRQRPAVLQYLIRHRDQQLQGLASTPWTSPAAPRHRGAAHGHVSPCYRIRTAGRACSTG